MPLIHLHHCIVHRRDGGGGGGAAAASTCTVQDIMVLDSDQFHDAFEE